MLNSNEYWKKTAYLDYDDNDQPIIKSHDGADEIPLADFTRSDLYDGVATICNTAAYAINWHQETYDETLDLYLIG